MSSEYETLNVTSDEDHTPIRERSSENTRLPAEAQACLQGLTGYINAGGRGTRLNPIFTPDSSLGISKALLGIGRPAIPLIEHQINKMLAGGVMTIVVGAGDHKHVAAHVASRYSTSAHVWPLTSEKQLGTGGDLVQAVREHGELFDEQIIVTNVDTLLDLNEGDMLSFHREHDADVTIALTLNTGVPNEGAYFVNKHGRVVHCAETGANATRAAVRDTAFRASSTGAVIINRTILNSVSWQPDDEPLSLYKDIMKTALAEGSVFAFNNGNRLFTDVGTVDSWMATQDAPDTIENYLYRTEPA